MPITAPIDPDPALTALIARSGRRRTTTTAPALPEVPPGGAPVHVRVLIDAGSERPDLVLWSDRLWAVREIVGYQLVQPGSTGAVAEHRWWVRAAPGRTGGEVMLQLAQSYPSGQWRIRTCLTGSTPAGVPEPVRCR